MAQLSEQITMSNVIDKLNAYHDRIETYVARIGDLKEQLVTLEKSLSEDYVCPSEVKDLRKLLKHLDLLLVNNMWRLETQVDTAKEFNHQRVLFQLERANEHIKALKEGKEFKNYERDASEQEDEFLKNTRDVVDEYVKLRRFADAALEYTEWVLYNNKEVD